MFCLMDVSASMDESTKDLAKRFFTLLYLFLTPQVRAGRARVHPPHRERRGSRRRQRSSTTEAGGTVVLSALELMDEIRRERYAERLEHLRARRRRTATNSAADPAKSARYLRETLLPLTRYYAYVELAEEELIRAHAVGRVRACSPRSSKTSRCSRASRREDIYPVFRNLFEQGASEPVSRRAARKASDWSFELIERYHGALPPLRRSSASTPIRTRSRSSPPSRCSTRMRAAGCRSAIRTGRTARSSSPTSSATGAASRASRTRSSSTPIPCIAYLMEENTMAMQALVIAHASYGHNSFLQGQLPVPQWTGATRSSTTCVYARSYIDGVRGEARRRRGRSVLDSCHALMTHGVDRYRRPAPPRCEAESARRADREATQRQVNDMWRTLPAPNARAKTAVGARFPTSRRRTCCTSSRSTRRCSSRGSARSSASCASSRNTSIRRRQTQVMNEGWATFWHYTLLNRLYDKGCLTDGFMIECCKTHTNVVYPAAVRSTYYRGINPYALGFAMYTDLRRICEQPDAEDREWFPDMAGSDWRRRSTTRCATSRTNFVAQYLSPKLIRDFRLFSIVDDETRRARSRRHPRRTGYRRVRSCCRTRAPDRLPDVQSSATTATAIAR